MAKFRLSKKGRERITNGYMTTFTEHNHTDGYTIDVVLGELRIAKLSSDRPIIIEHEAGLVLVDGSSGQLYSQVAFDKQEP